MTSAVIILAAGKGTRMKSQMPKVLHPIAGAPMLAHAIHAAQSFDPDRLFVVAGHGAEQVGDAARAFHPDAEIVIQAEQKGTAHAVDQTRDALAGFDGDAVVLFGDTPFVSRKTLASVFEARASGADVVVLGFEAANPGGYGRLIGDGHLVTEIVGAKDATPAQLDITLCNSGVVAAKTSLLFDLISEVTPHNKQGEYYLTDVIAMAAVEKKCHVLIAKTYRPYHTRHYRFNGSRHEWRLWLTRQSYVQSGFPTIVLGTE